MFNSGIIKIKCESKYDDFVLKNEELNLGKELTVYDNNNPSRHSQRPGYNPGFNPGGNNGIGQLPRDSRVYDNEIIHRYLEKKYVLEMYYKFMINTYWFFWERDNEFWDKINLNNLKF